MDRANARYSADTLPRGERMAPALLAGLGRQLGEVTLQAWHGKIDEGAHLRHRETSLRRQQMRGQRRVFILVEQDLQPSFPDLLGDMIGEQPRNAVPFRRGGDRGADRVDDQPRRELHGSRNG